MYKLTISMSESALQTIQSVCRLQMSFMSVKEPVKEALRKVLKEELQGVIRETIQEGNRESIQNLFPGTLQGALKEPPYGFKLEHSQRYFKKHFKGTVT